MKHALPLVNPFRFSSDKICVVRLAFCAGKSITPEISFLISFAILVEVICVWFILRRSLRPRFFVLWLIGMHLITYPAFLGLLWVLQAMRPAFAVAIGEGLVVVVEGLIIYGICWSAGSGQFHTSPTDHRQMLDGFFHRQCLFGGGVPNFGRHF